jgi:hypothetical protein
MPEPSFRINLNIDDYINTCMLATYCIDRVMGEAIDCVVGSEELT